MINIRIYLFLLAGTLFFFFLLRHLSVPLVHFDSSQWGILNLELARQSNQTENIVTNWQAAGLLKTARQNVWLDFLFIPFYSLLIYSLCGSISVRLNGMVSNWGIFLAFGGLIAGFLDVLENVLLLFSLNGNFQGWISFFSWLFASGKFFLLGLALLYILVFGLYLVAWKIRKRMGTS